MSVKLRSTGPGVLVAEIPFRVSRDWEQWVLLRSDAHHDNPHCLQDWEKRHLDQAIERNAGILDNGDLFCAMQGKGDRRHAKDDVRPEHQCGNYLDALVRTAADFYQPYAKNWWMFGRGNHEMAVEKVHETDLTERLAQTLRDRTGAPCPVGGYRGYFAFAFRGTNTTQSYRFSMYYEHGAGGGGPVTKGIIQANRRQVPHRADLYWSGHIHNDWTMNDMADELDRQFRLKFTPVRHIQTSTYKQEYMVGKASGYHDQNCRPPTPLGAKWLRFYWEDNAIRHEVQDAPVHLD